MLLTLAAPPKSQFDFKHPHDYPLSTSTSISRPSPKDAGGPLPTLSEDRSRRMSTPHRGLPPPAAMTLPDPSRAPPSSISQPLGQMPAPPSQWQGAEDSMRNWLLAKAEEDKRKQEEEKTKQETLKLDQRRIEQSILRESIQGGIPTHLIPMIFAGMGGGSLTGLSVEYLQQYMAGLQQQQQLQQSQHAPDARRESQVVNPAYAAQVQSGAPVTSILQSQPGQAQAGSSMSTFQLGSSSPRVARAHLPSQAAGPTSAPRPPPHAALPRLTTNEMNTQQSSSSAPGAHAVHQGQQQSQQESSSPSIYFHHWVPPTSQSSGARDPPSTPTDYTSSPKKRKATGVHPQAPAPHRSNSPSIAHHPMGSGRRSGHVRTRSDSLRGSEAIRATGRQRSGTHQGTSSEAHSRTQPSEREYSHQIHDYRPPQSSESERSFPTTKVESPPGRGLPPS